MLLRNTVPSAGAACTRPRSRASKAAFAKPVCRSRATSVAVRAFQPSESQTTAPAPAKQPPRVSQSGTALLQDLEQATNSLGHVYGKPLSKSELAGRQACVADLPTGVLNGGREALRQHCLNLLQEAATLKQMRLDIVEGAMVLLEQMYMDENRNTEKLQGVWSPADMLCRWQLVIGADVGGIQYIPVTEELEVARDGETFDLDTDMDLLFAGFRGTSRWLSPGHLLYTTKKARLELRTPKGWKRAGIWLKWRMAQAHTSPPRDQRGEPHYGMAAPDAPTCRPDHNRPHFDLPLPFPDNELFIFACNGDVAVTRSKLGGLILLLNKTPADQRKQLAA